jgi:magnesium chelatase family protein
LLAIVHACAIVGLEGEQIEVQVDFNPRASIPQFSIVGLPDSAVRESKERVRAAIKNSSLQFPPKGYVVNLSPADLQKHGPAYDLAIAVGVLAATDQVPLHALSDAMFAGELSLDGRICHVKGAMSIAYCARTAGLRTLYVPEEDAPQAALIDGIDVIGVASLGQLVEHLYGMNVLTPQPAWNLDNLFNAAAADHVDFADIRGQEHVKRVLEIAAAGGHNVRMVGSPGVGKSLLARAMAGILPRLTHEEAMEVTRIYSVADLLEGQPIVSQRPFRAPHHTISQAGLVGGGSLPKPGEVSLSHRGVLFLDEVNEFSLRTLEALRQPIEDRVVTISRAHGTLTFPTNFLLVMAHNPCPCGYHGDPSHACTCSPALIERYMSKLSGPLLDRIDIHIYVPRVDYDRLLSDERAETSTVVRERVEAARARQRERFAEHPHLFSNSDMTAREVTQLCVLSSDARKIMDLTVRRMQLSARAYHRVLKLSRTIADLAESELIQAAHVAEAVQYRSKAGST